MELAINVVKTVLTLALSPLLLPVVGQKIAIIGGAVSGSFSAKYLADYDKDCIIESITVFEPNPVNHAHSPLSNHVGEEKNYLQGSRVSTLQLADGTIVELGASILHEGFHHGTRDRQM
jgi:prenylcysteine oxidase / farnesylcysteine lyase